MFRTKTVFIIGAGASYEVGLPLGNELSLQIADRLRFRLAHDEPFDGDRHILRALHEHADEHGKPRGDYIRVARQIADAMGLAPSIDNYIDAHKGNSLIETSGKLAILRCILDAERASRMKAPEGWSDGRWLAGAHLRDTWFNVFFKRLVEEVRQPNVANIFDNVGFIVFNYDRCVEHFLFYALQSYYHLSEHTAASLMQRLKICHPYGVVGKLTWQDIENGVPYGETSEELRLLTLIPNVRTFTEGVSDKGTTDTVHEMLGAAHHVVFLGFAYHELNLKILRPGGGVNKSIIGTAYGVSDPDSQVVQNQINDCLKPIIFYRTHNDLVCYRLLETYSKFLAS